MAKICKEDLLVGFAVFIGDTVCVALQKPVDDPSRPFLCMKVVELWRPFDLACRLPQPSQIWILVVEDFQYDGNPSDRFLLGGLSQPHMEALPYNLSNKEYGFGRVM